LRQRRPSCRMSCASIRWHCRCRGLKPVPGIWCSTAASTMPKPCAARPALRHGA
jgi:hypothetical protein